MSRIIKDSKLNPKKLRSFDFTVYEEVERGQRPFDLIKVGEMDYVPGETQMKVASFDEEVELHRAVVVQDAGAVRPKKFVPESFDSAPKELIVHSEEAVQTEADAEPEKPSITEEELEAIRREAYQKGMADGMNRGLVEGEQKAKKAYDAEQADYLAKLQATYNEVIAQAAVFRSAVDQLDAQLPDIVTSMVTDIIGTERKINNDLVVSVTRKSLDSLRDMEKIVFLVNPDDVATMSVVFPDYETQPDRNVAKGSLKVQTNVGELNFCIERMLDEFAERIHEEFGTPEGS
ncbi:FliH/SctL family protein [Seleniivibrio woodruffii]|uniref:Flagellar assembly protein FliH n=1 Tax=Seleniivibrio woodruffii TaxID=1078050 RepID=A0A4R1K6X9_9BACT|nr:FliH/SctL family protein [Seleniivibrio woodruffii]TCK60015.1 flagellar assembly protein FliH [Seleniivibrio woodruffii]TVZ35764.1 flagellar assembly protein FliH [Seleniivibrio woodruffii]